MLPLESPNDPLEPVRAAAARRYLVLAAGFTACGGLIAAWLPGASLGLRAAIVVTCFALAALTLWAALRALRDAGEREHRFAELVGIAADAYWETDAELRITALWCRDEIGRDQFSRVDVSRVVLWELPGLLMAPGALDDWRERMHRRAPFRDVRMGWQRPDGQQRHDLVSGAPRFDATGSFTGYWGVARYVDAEVRAQQAIQASEARYHNLFTSLPAALVLHRHGDIIDANPAAALLFGFADAPSMPGHSVFEVYDDDSRERGRARLRHLDTLPVGTVLPLTEFKVLTLDGRHLSVRATTSRIDADDGPAMLSFYFDDTERHVAIDALRRSEALLTQLIARNPDVVVLSERDTGRYAMVNEAFERLTGWSAQEVVGRTSFDIGAWGDPEDRARMLAELARNGRVDGLPTVLVDRHGRRHPMLLAAAPFTMDGRDYIIITARDTTESERLRLEREAILTNASIGITMTRGQKYLMANPAFESMLGWGPGELVGQPGSVVWPDAQAYAEFGARYGPLLGQGRQIETEALMARRDGSTFTCRLLARAVDLKNPREGGTVWIAEDVTERRRTEQALAKARDDAEAASRAKSAFLANTSHEIRTPLNALVGLAHLARRQETEPRKRDQYLDQIAASAEALSAILSDILDLSKIEAGRLDLELRDFDLHRLLGELQHAYATLAEARALTLTLDIDAGVPHRVHGDAVRLRQILANYLSNAIKFTAAGGVRLRAAPGPEQRLRFEVHDSGSGIDAATRARLFQPFTQADDSITRRFGGTGLGLSICRELAELMGGAVGVHSTPGQGSCFWAELPMRPGHADAEPSDQSPLDADPLHGARVLLVEDNAVNMMIGVAMLEQWGVQVTQAADGPQALAAVADAQRLGQEFDAVLMDVQMPGMSGYEATRALRDRHSARQLPIIALTAAALTSERDRATAIGMNDFLTKPIDPNRLRATLQRAIRGRAAT